MGREEKGEELRREPREERMGRGVGSSEPTLIKRGWAPASTWFCGATRKTQEHRQECLCHRENPRPRLKIEPGAPESERVKE